MKMSRRNRIHHLAAAGVLCLASTPGSFFAAGFTLHPTSTIDKNSRQSLHVPKRRREFIPSVSISSSSDSSSSTGQQQGEENNLPQERISKGDDDDNTNDARLVPETFAELYGAALPDWLLVQMTNNGWTHPTRIQKTALNAILLDKQDAVVQAQTGSGKTLSFLVPLLANVDPSRAAVQALIVVPTRELGLQVGRVAKRLAANSETTSQDQPEGGGEEEDDDGATTTTITTGNNNNKIMIMTVLQGSKNRRQRAWAWAEPPQVVIGTPDELCNMIRLGGIKRYNSVKYVVVDEVDACLLNNAGTMTSNLSSSTLHELLSKYLSPTYDDGSTTAGSSKNPKHTNGEEDTTVMRRGSSSPKGRPLSQVRQTIFCSATIPQHRHFMKQCVQNQWVLSKDPKHICLQTGEQLVPPSLDHAYMVCASSEKKLAALRRILQKISDGASSSDDDDSSSGMGARKVLIFAEPQRPLEEMAQVLANDLNGLLWKETYGPEEEAEASAIVGVLRYEDSLSQRAAAIQGFTGDTNAPISKYQWKNHIPVNKDTRPANDNVKLRVLLSTDLAARGLDILGITHVIQLDLAPDADSYVHRAGRGGRFGAEGQIVSIITPEQEFVLQRLGNKLFLDMECIARQKKQQ